jgi:hypothetical protein
MEYKRTIEFGWTSDDGETKIQVFKDNSFYKDGGLMIKHGNKAIRQTPEQILEWLYELFERDAFPFRIGRIGFANERMLKYEGWKPLFWRFHWKMGR